MKWRACREFSQRDSSLLYIFVGPVILLLAAGTGLVETFNDRLMLVCVLTAAYNFAAATELAYDHGEQLPSRWLAILLLALTSASFLSWLPLIVIKPIPELGTVIYSSWFPIVILITLLLRTALAFVVLAMAKERQEQEQRVDALTDSLTGLPNRRALFEVADAVAQRRILGGTPVSVLILDLDHFKDTNDSYGHSLGDEVLKVFAMTAEKNLKVNSIVGRWEARNSPPFSPASRPPPPWRPRSACAGHFPARPRSSTVWLLGRLSAWASPPTRRWMRISRTCFGGPTRRFISPSGRAAIRSLSSNRTRTWSSPRSAPRSAPRPPACGQPSPRCGPIGHAPLDRIGCHTSTLEPALRAPHLKWDCGVDCDSQM